jgi:hypothetical protein
MGIAAVLLIASSMSPLIRELCASTGLTDVMHILFITHLVDQYGTMPLILASNAKMAALMLDRGADIDARTGVRY